MLQAVQEAQNLGLPFDEVFPHQYAARMDNAPTPEGWECKNFAPFKVHHSPRLNVAHPECTDDALELLILGIAVDNGTVVTNDTQIDFGATGTWRDLEDWLENLAGRFVIFSRLGHEQRLYFDPTLELPCFYDPKTGHIGSSPYMVLDRPIAPGRYIRTEDVLSGTTNFTLGFTADRDIRLARPNHSLNLDRYQQYRHWPRSEAPFAEDADIDAVASDIVTRLGATVGALARSFRSVIPVTGGYDSRALLASAKDHLGHVSAFYTHRTNYMSSLDCMLAAQIGERLGFTPKLIDGVTLAESPDSAPEISRKENLFSLRTGHHSPIMGHRELIAEDFLPDGQISMRGNVMDINRAFQWKGQNAFRFAHLVRRLRLRAPEGIQPAVFWEREIMTWMDTLPDGTRPVAFDLSWFENILPNSMGIMFNGMPRYFTLSPFNDRYLTSRSMRISPALRRDGDLNAAILLQSVPELAELPYNQEIKRDPEARRSAEALFAG
ncbi:hypothetical protein [Ruegeria halocynthiae]|uniref:hypothetical protein n=1 Tax=Ruegeria halocynthiae TaxID=985054 RepID=UPI00055F7BBE|nr:hypothetical protein [Ruegeria halocynthiae]